MRLALVNVENGILSIGFRKMASVTRSYHPETSIRYVTPGRRNSIKEFLFPSPPRDLNDLGEEIARGLNGADVVAFSSMSINSETVTAIITHLRRISPRTFIVWGGAHGILEPESAIQHADAVCTGEGEVAFLEFLEAYRNGRDYFGTGNFWFRKGDDVVMNPFLPLLSNDDLARNPPPLYADPVEKIYEPGSGFVPLTRNHYLKFNGLAYRTVWSIGCPFRCTFCANSKFIENDPTYSKIRHSPLPLLMRELRGALSKHPHLGAFVFDDDSFMALPVDVLEGFAHEYKEKIGIPLTVTGVIPNYVKEEKLRILTGAGLIRIRMGIQSGSPRLLKFYERPAPPEKVLHAAEIANRFRRVMIPPAFDVITDNPIENEDDIRKTLQLAYDLPRPFTLNIFSLIVMPNTALAKQFEELGLDAGPRRKNFKTNTPTLANCTLYLLCLVRPPKWIFDRLLARAKPAKESQPLYPTLLRLLRLAWLIRRGLSHLRFMEFSNLPGRVGYFLYRLGALRFWHRYLNPHAPPPPLSDKARIETA